MIERRPGTRRCLAGRRVGFRSILEGDTDTEVVDEATHSLEAVQPALDLKPDVMLMDIRMPELDARGATARITSDERLHDVKILILTTFDIADNVYAALRAAPVASWSRTPRPWNSSTPPA